MATSVTLLKTNYDTKLQRYLEADRDTSWLQERLQDSEFAQQLEQIWGCSDFVANQAITHPEAFEALLKAAIFNAHTLKIIICKPCSLRLLV